MLRKLRIAFSVVCGITCLLLMAAWFRSHIRTDSLRDEYAGRVFGVTSNRGHFNIYVFGRKGDEGIKFRGWKVRPIPFLANEYRWPLNDAPWIISAFGFGWHFARGEAGLLVPYWFWVLVIAALTAVPWLKVKWRFSLRAFLIAIAIVAALLGNVIYAVK